MQQLTVVPFLLPPPIENPPEIVEIEVKEFKPPTWKCPDCTPEEKYVLEQIQENTKIKDRNALATIMGNIKQESKFISNICEGGARVSYRNCHGGGYGLIQWTSVNRYNNLGKFCEKYGCDPSSLEGQTRYMINEKIFQNQLPEFEGSGKTVLSIWFLLIIGWDGESKVIVSYMHTIM